MGSERRRADTLLAERGLAASRTAAAASVRAGCVRIGRDGPSISKPSQMVPSDAELIVDSGPEFVSRGGVKLANALAEFDEQGDAVPVEGRDCLDVGASTGGFTDCLLSRGAARVVALDVGYGQLAWELRHDDRVTVMERVNARVLAGAELPFAPGLVAVDVSFISLALLLGPIAAVAADDLDLLAMVKPQFELGPERVGRGGVVREAADRRDAIQRVAAAGEREGFVVRGLASSGLPGPKGNRETFIRFARSGDAADLDAELERVEPSMRGPT